MSGRWVRETRSGPPQQATAAATARLVPPIGQGVALRHWQLQARGLVMPHALVVEGTQGIGKSTVLRWLAASLACPSDIDETGPCGVCRTCCQVAAGVFADMHMVERAKNDGDKTKENSFYAISIDQVRAAQKRLARHAVEGRARMLVIADADCMTEGAQNALLKTLEEPGASTFLLLEARRPEQLLPTVRSRVQRLRLLPLGDSTILRELSQRLPGSSAWFERAVAVARGSLGLALLACTERVVHIHDLVHALLAATNGLRPVATARAVLEGAQERRSEIEAARLFLWLVRAELRRRLEALAVAGAPSYPLSLAEPWTTWLESTLAADRDLDLQIPPEQVLTACLVGLPTL